MEVNTDWKSLPISIFMCLKRPLNWLKIKITKVGESLNGIAKQCIKLNVCKSVTRNVLYDLLHTGCVRYRNVSSRAQWKFGPKNDVRYRELSTIKCPLLRVLLQEFDRRFIRS